MFIVILVSIFAGYTLVNQKTHTEGNIQINDMVGRSVVVPSMINKVIATAPPTTNLVYMIAPDKLGAWNSILTDKEKLYIPQKYQDLPVVGGWFSSNQGNPETFVVLNPNVVLYDYNNNTNSSPTMDSMQQMMGSIPVVGIQSSNNVTNFTPSIEFTGRLLGQEGNANKLVTFINQC